VSDWREKLKSRFRATSLERIREVTRILGGWNTEACDEGQRQHVLRELHTFKGDARLLGMLSISDVVHAAEECLSAPPVESPGAGVAVVAVLDVVAEVLRGGLPEDRSDSALREARRWLDEILKRRKSSAPPPPSIPPEPDSAPRSAPLQPPPSVPLPHERWVHVRVADIEDLCETVVDFTTDFRLMAAQLKNVDSRAIRDACDRCLSQLESITSAAWAFRMVPIEPVLEDLARHARDLAKGQEKTIRTVARGRGAQMDRSVLDALWDPMVHLIRNAVDHGIELPQDRSHKPQEALIEIDAEQAGAQVILVVSDDGKGIDVDRVRAAAVKKGVMSAEAVAALSDAQARELIFHHGFSTRETANDLSGRGVGLDVVRGAIEALGGSVNVTSEVGRGARFMLRVPAKISKERVLVVSCGNLLYAIPAQYLLEVMRFRDATLVETEGGNLAVDWRDERLPLRSMVEAVSTGPMEPEPWLALLQIGGGHYAFTLPHLVGERDLIRRPVDDLVSSSGFVVASGALDDGRLVLVVSLVGLLRRADRTRAAA
jgi:two-component system chemotaxis sensor kinase CheA